MKRKETLILNFRKTPSAAENLFYKLLLRASISWLLPALLLLTLPAAVQAQFTFVTNNGAITITGYTGAGGAVTIPDTTNGYPVASVGTGAFSNCTSVTSVTMGTNLTSIGDYAFDRSGLTGVTMGTSLTNIGYYAFGYCTSLTNVTIPNSVTNIGEAAFYYCTHLASVTIGTNVTSIGLNAFMYCSRLASVAIPNSITNIGQAAFYYCTNLASVTIGTNVISLGNNAFYNCTKLTSITIPNSVTSIGSSAFEACINLASITLSTNLTSIGTYAFDSCYSLTNITTIPASVISIGSFPFWATLSLPAITVDTNNPAFSSVAGVLFNKSQTIVIEAPGGLAGGYIVPNSVTNIGGYAFVYCMSLTSVTISNTVTSIGDDAFIYCSSLTNVMIGNSVTNIGYDVFYGCTSLRAIMVDINNPAYSSVAGVLFNKSQTILVVCPGGLAGSYIVPNSVTSIGYEAFEDCRSLTNVTIPKSVSNIGSVAFEYCPNLTGVYFQGQPPTMGSSVFSGVNNKAAVYYLPGSTGWNPQVDTSGASFGVRTNQFGFNITGSNGLSIVVVACTNLANPIWASVATNTLTAGSSYFGDPAWTNYPCRFYRLWSLTFAGLPAVLWNPAVQTSDGSFGVGTNGFGFNITGTTNIPIVLEACTNLTSPAWTTLRSCNLTNGLIYFSDPQWANYPSRFYRIRSP